MRPDLLAAVSYLEIKRFESIEGQCRTEACPIIAVGCCVTGARPYAAGYSRRAWSRRIRRSTTLGHGHKTRAGFGRRLRLPQPTQLCEAPQTCAPLLILPALIALLTAGNPLGQASASPVQRQKIAPKVFIISMVSGLRRPGSTPRR